MNKKNTERREAIVELRGLLAPGFTVYTILRSVSRSGMSRNISPVYLSRNEAGAWPYNIAWKAGRAIDAPVVESMGHFAVKIGGAGMDMGFHLVYNLAWAVFSAHPLLELAVDPRLPAWERENNRLPHDAGYALSQRWL